MLLLSFPPNAGDCLDDLGTLCVFKNRKHSLSNKCPAEKTNWTAFRAIKTTIHLHNELLFLF